MNQSTPDAPLTPLQKAEYAARCFAERKYRDCSAWSVVIRKTYGVRSLLRDLNSNPVDVTEEGEEPFRETIYVVPEGGLAQFTPEEAYLIVQSLPSLTDCSP